MQLLLQSTWKETSPPSLLLTQEQVFGLIDLFAECAAADLPLSCDYAFITSDGGWLPVFNTFTAPGSCIPVGTVYPSASYVGGQGWQAFFDCTNSTLFIYKDITGLSITRVVVIGRCDEVRHLHVTVNTTTDVITADVGPGTWIAVADGTWAGIHMEIDNGKAFDSDINAFITEVQITATGPACP